MSVRGKFLEPYMPQIKGILRKALRIQNKEGHGLAVTLLRNLLRSLTTVYPKEYWSCPEGYDRPLSEYLPIRHWGKPGNIHSLKVSSSCQTSQYTVSFSVNVLCHLDVKKNQYMKNYFCGDILKLVSRPVATAWGHFL